MAVSKELITALRNVVGSDATISRRATNLIREHGPMEPDEARWVIAHDAGIDLRKHLSSGQLDRVRQLRSAIKSRAAIGVEASPVRRSAPAEQGTALTTEEQPPTPASLFNSRALHAEVVTSSRKLFVGEHYTDAIRKAFQRVNNRVRHLTKLSAKDGEALMGEAFKDANPALQMSDLASVSEQNEHAGVKFLMMGAMRAMRNPRSHEDAWEPDRDPVAVLEAMALASMLHRFLDRCEAYRNSKSAATGPAASTATH